MRYRKLDTNKDYAFGHGTRDFYADNEAVAQALSTRLRLFLGEWWEDLSLGLPMFQTILGKRATNDNLKAAELVINDTIIATKGVTRINSINVGIDAKTRTLSYRATVDTIYSTSVTIEEVL